MNLFSFGYSFQNKAFLSFTQVIPLVQTILSSYPEITTALRLPFTKLVYEKDEINDVYTASELTTKGYRLP